MGYTPASILPLAPAQGQLVDPPNLLALDWLRSKRDPSLGKGGLLKPEGIV